MSLLVFLIVSGVLLGLAYRVLGGRLARYLELSPTAPVPSHTKRDGADYEPAKASFLLPQHFSAIAAAGPIVGPILAATYFGWVPAWLWIIVGSVLIGGVHDLTTLVASVRHDGHSIAEVVRRHMNRRTHLLFLSFIWISLIYVIVAFTDVTAGAFVQPAGADGSDAPGPAVATASILYLLLSVAMGLTLRHTKLGEGKAKLIFLPLVFVAIAVSPYIPIDLGSAFGLTRPQLAWDYLLLTYCFLAAITPVWALLQPRGALGGYFLYIVIAVGVLGILIGGVSGDLDIRAPAFGAGSLLHFEGGVPPILPVLFITVACGACSGFHSIVSSGTTSKQLDRETDAKPVAYGGMLLEAFFACISLASVMILAKPTGRPDLTFSDGVAVFMHHATFGFVSIEHARLFGLLCFATFIFDTLDACTRLARYVLMELTGWKGRAGQLGTTALTLAIPAALLTLPPATLDGKALPLWRVFWNLFGSSNQLLAALTLIGVTVWLRSLGKRTFVTLLPAVFMLAMTCWSLGITLQQYLARAAAGKAALLHQVEAGVAVLLLGMTLWMTVEAALLGRKNMQPSRIAESPH